MLVNVFYGGMLSGFLLTPVFARVLCFHCCGCLGVCGFVGFAHRGWGPLEHVVLWWLLGFWCGGVVGELYSGCEHLKNIFLMINIIFVLLIHCVI